MSNGAFDCKSRAAEPVLGADVAILLNSLMLPVGGSFDSCMMKHTQGSLSHRCVARLGSDIAYLDQERPTRVRTDGGFANCFLSNRSQSLWRMS